MKRKVAFLTIMGLLIVALAGFAGGKQEAQKAPGVRYKYFVILHGLNDPFWAVITKGAQDAASFIGCDVQVLGPQVYNIQQMVDILETAISSNPDGIAITIPDVQALDEPLKRAIKEKHIPIVAINVPDFRPVEQRIPYLAYVGQDEYLVGVYAAHRILQEFGNTVPKRGVVSIHSPGHAGLEKRAQGFTDVFKEKGIPVEKLATSNDSAKCYQIAEAYLTEHPDTDVIFTVGPNDSIPIIALRKDKNIVSKVKQISCDLSEQQVSAIKEGTLTATIEQQQYLQGYLPIGLLTLYNKYGIIPHGDILTGPSVVDAGNVALVEAMVKKGIR